MDGVGTNLLVKRMLGVGRDVACQVFDKMAARKIFLNF
jgi:hypothetical protein